MRLAGQAGGPIAPTRTAPKARFRIRHSGLAQTPTPARKSGSQVRLIVRLIVRPQKSRSSDQRSSRLSAPASRVPRSRAVSTRLFSMNRYETATKQVC
jgi:hypothetical protein